MLSLDALVPDRHAFNIIKAHVTNGLYLILLEYFSEMTQVILMGSNFECFYLML